MKGLSPDRLYNPLAELTETLVSTNKNDIILARSINNDDDFPSGVSLLKIPDSVRGFA